jgi:hypothetical protein
VKAAPLMTLSPQLRELVDRVVVPALLERFLREHGAAAATGASPAPPADRPQVESPRP